VKVIIDGRKGQKSFHRLPSVINDKPNMKKERFRAVPPESTAD